MSRIGYLEQHSLWEEGSTFSCSFLQRFWKSVVMATSILWDLAIYTLLDFRCLFCFSESLLCFSSRSLRVDELLSSNVLFLGRKCFDTECCTGARLCFELHNLLFNVFDQLWIENVSKFEGWSSIMPLNSARSDRSTALALSWDYLRDSLRSISDCECGAIMRENLFIPSRSAPLRNFALKSVL